MASEDSTTTGTDTSKLLSSTEKSTSNEDDENPTFSSNTTTAKKSSSVSTSEKSTASASKHRKSSKSNTASNSNGITTSKSKTTDDDTGSARSSDGSYVNPTAVGSLQKSAHSSNQSEHSDKIMQDHEMLKMNSIIRKPKSGNNIRFNMDISQNAKKVTPLDTKSGDGSDKQNIAHHDDSAIWGDLSMDINNGSKVTGSRSDSTSPAPFKLVKMRRLYFPIDDCSINSGCHWWASMKTFCALACIMITVHGCLSAGYTFSVLSTVEKRFAINSIIAGLVISSYELGSLLSVVFVSYFGAHGHVPRWIGAGGICLCLGSLLFSTPHFLAPDYQPPSINSSGPGVCINMFASMTPNRFSTLEDGTVTKHHLEKSLLSRASDILEESPFVTGYVWVLVFAQILIGAGGSPIFTLGTAYIDNHVEKESATIYLAFMYLMMAVGPVMGFLLGALLLGEYVDPFKVPPKMETTSPYWIGLWWGGYLICGIFYFLASLPFFVFPRRLPNPSLLKEAAHKENEYGRTWKKIPVSICNLLKNRVYMMTTLAACVELAIVSGFTTFLPKYIETQFNLSPSSASGLMGLVAIPGACVGIFFGGWAIKYFKLEMKGVVTYILVVNMGTVLLLSLFFSFGCDNLKIAGLTVDYDSSLEETRNLSSSCNSNCGCLSSKYSPVCGVNNVTYVSPCHAGCVMALNTGKQRTSIVGDVIWQTYNYTGCACIAPSYNGTYPHEAAKTLAAREGVCRSDCKMLVPFLISLFLISLAASNNQMPLVLTTLRSVAEEEKAFALGIQMVMLRLFGYIPAPMIYGAVIDSACMLHSDAFIRRDQASCLLYDIGAFRLHFSVVSSILMIIGLVFCVLLWYSVRQRYTPFSPPVTMSEIVLRMGDIENLHIRPSMASLRSWVSDDSLYSRPRSPRHGHQKHQKTMSC